ncbi:hypothetical protein D918_04247, partial [Trichuris suis]
LQRNSELALLNERNRRYPLHLKSSYPIEAQAVIDSSLEEELKQSDGLPVNSLLRVADRLERTNNEEKKSDKSAMRMALWSGRKTISSRLSKAVSLASASAFMGLLIFYFHPIRLAKPCSISGRGKKTAANSVLHSEYPSKGKEVEEQDSDCFVVK